MPVAGLLLVWAYCVHDDLGAFLAKDHREGESGNAESPASLLVCLARFRIAFDLGEDRLDLGNKLSPIASPRLFQILRLMQEFSASGRVDTQRLHRISLVASAITSSASYSVASPRSYAAVRLRIS